MLKLRFLWSCLFLFSCINHSGVERFTSTKVFAHLAQTIMDPAFQKFQFRIENLKRLHGKFTLQMTSQNLESLQKSWKEAAESWKCAEIMYAGKLRESFLYTKIHSSISETSIHEILEGRFDYQSGVLGVSKQGLGAIEYLIFSPNLSTNDQIKLRFSNSVHTAFLGFLIDRLEENTTKLIAVWEEEKSALLSIGSGMYLYEKQAVDTYVNRIIFYVEDIRMQTLGKLLGKATGTEMNAHYLEAKYSRTSKELFLNRLKGLETLFFGGTGLGFDDILSARGSELQYQIKEEIERFIEIAQGFQGSFADQLLKDTKAFELLYQQSGRLLQTLKVDLPAQLNVSIGFSDNDGD